MELKYILSSKFKEKKGISMLLQDIYQPENLEKERHFHVVLDEGSQESRMLPPPEKLQEISFVAKLDNGILNNDLLDTIISYRRRKVEVILEIPLHFLKDEFEEDVSNYRSLLKYFMSMAHNADVCLSILPANHPLSEENLGHDFYSKVIVKAVKELTSRTKYDKIIVPVSNYMEYLMTERILGEDKVKNFKPVDKYVIDNFHSIMPVEESDKLKDNIRHTLYDFYGGKDEFDLVCYEIIKAVYGKHEESFKHIVREDLIRQNIITPDGQLVQK